MSISWPAPPNIAFSCPDCTSSRYEVISHGFFSVSEFGGAKTLYQMPGTVERRRVKCSGCGREYSLQVHQNGLVEYNCASPEDSITPRGSFMAVDDGQRRWRTDK